MSQKKLKYITWAAILNFISAGMTLFLLIMVLCAKFDLTVFMDYFGSAEQLSALTVKITLSIMLGISFALSFIAGLLLILSAKKNAKNLFIGGVVTTLIMGLVSIPAILCYIALSTPDELPAKEVTQPNIKDEVEKLRSLREQNLISEDEFKTMLFKIIDKNKN